MYLLFTFYHLHKKGVLRLFYINYVALCNKIGKSPSAVAEELGFMRSVVTRWSKGTIPRQATLQKVADYFGVSVEYLLGKEKHPTIFGELSGPKKALIDFVMPLSDEDAETVLQIAQIALARKTK